MDENHPHYTYYNLLNFCKEYNDSDVASGELTVEFMLTDDEGMSQIVGLQANSRDAVNDVIMMMAAAGTTPLFPLVGRDNDNVWTLYTFNDGRVVGLLGTNLDGTAIGTAKRVLQDLARLEMVKGLESESFPDNPADFLAKASGNKRRRPDGHR